MFNNLNSIDAAAAEADLHCHSALLRVFLPSESNEPSTEAPSIAADVPWTLLSPLRFPDWRWQSACERETEKDSDAAKALESSIDKAAQLIRMQSTWDANNEFATNPATIGEAHGIYANNDVISWLIEAWILTAADDETIGEALGLKPELIAVYELLFFNVRERLAARDYILHVIGREQEVARPPRVSVVQHMAYQSGPEALSAALSALGGSEGLKGHPLPQVDLSAPEGRDKARVQLCIELNALSAEELSPSIAVELATWDEQTCRPVIPSRSYRANWESVLRLLSDHRAPCATKVSPENGSIAAKNQFIASGMKEWAA